MKILVVGYTTNWKTKVLAALPEECDIIIKGDAVQAIEAQETVPDGFSLYILGNRLCEYNDAGLLILREARAIGDETPTIIFSDQVSDTVHVEIEKLGGMWIHSSSSKADERLACSVAEILAN